MRPNLEKFTYAFIFSTLSRINKTSLLTPLSSKCLWNQLHTRFRKWCHINPALASLHWLHELILQITSKSCLDLGPSYKAKNPLTSCEPFHSLTSWGGSRSECGGQVQETLQAADSDQMNNLLRPNKAKPPGSKHQLLKGRLSDCNREVCATFRLQACFCFTVLYLGPNAFSNCFNKLF